MRPASRLRVELARLLLAAGADTAPRKERAGLSALDYAEKAGQSELIELLKV